MNHTGGVGRAVDCSRRETAAGTWVGIFLIVLVLCCCLWVIVLVVLDTLVNLCLIET